MSARATTAALVAATFVAGALAACAGSLADVRFHDRPPVWAIDDRLDVPRPPAPRRYARLLNAIDNGMYRKLTRTLAVKEPRRATNVNSLDEVPDDTWFTNRRVTPDDVRRGPGEGGGPDMSQPWKVTGTKIGGISIGFNIVDARGGKFILKFEQPAHPEVETGADVVVQRLLWALGYNVPEDTIVLFPREQLVLAPDATVKDFFGNKRPMTLDDLETRLARVRRRPDGSFRGLASRFVPGVPLGGIPQKGVRRDDPNDVVPHELRRDLRGQYVFFAWLDHNDIKEDNTLDMWTADPRDDKRHYVIHYLVDFGRAMGTSARDGEPSAGFAATFDYGRMLGSLLALGLWQRPWEAAMVPALDGVGRFESVEFEPADWRVQLSWLPFVMKDDADGFWAAKILARLGPAHIRAAVEQGKYSDPRAVEWLTRTLIERREKTLRYWFTRVNPLDGFEVRQGPSGASLCFDDLLLVHELGGGAQQTSYRATARGDDGAALPWSAAARPGSGGARTACLDGLQPPAAADGYTIVEIHTVRGDGGGGLGPVWVHLARNPGGQLAVIGLRR